MGLSSGAQEGFHFRRFRRVGGEFQEGAEVLHHFVRLLQAIVSQAGIVVGVSGIGFLLRGLFEQLGSIAVVAFGDSDGAAIEGDVGVRVIQFGGAIGFAFGLVQLLLLEVDGVYF